MLITWETHRLLYGEANTSRCSSSSCHMLRRVQDLRGPHGVSDRVSGPRTLGLSVWRDQTACHRSCETVGWQLNGACSHRKLHIGSSSVVNRASRVWVESEFVQDCARRAALFAVVRFLPALLTNRLTRLPHQLPQLAVGCAKLQSRLRSPGN